MSKKLIIATSVVLSCIFTPLVSLAEDAAPSTSTTSPNPATQNAPTSMTKDAWLNQMMPLLPSLICKGFVQDKGLKQRFDEMKITYDQCVGYVPDIATHCKEQYYSQLPAMIDDEKAGTWGRVLGECIGKDFATKFLIPH